MPNKILVDFSVLGFAKDALAEDEAAIEVAGGADLRLSRDRKSSSSSSSIGSESFLEDSPEAVAVMTTTSPFKLLALAPTRLISVISWDVVKAIVAER